MASDLSASEPQPDRSERPTSRGRARRIVARAAVALLTAGALVHPTATLLSRSSWRAELLCHFPLPGLTVTLTALSPRRSGGAGWRSPWRSWPCCKRSLYSTAWDRTPSRPTRAPRPG
ncbi:MAG: hypothetical protein ACM35G_05160, partial [Planctomycetaceae bacterium]